MLFAVSSKLNAGGIRTCLLQSRHRYGVSIETGLKRSYRLAELFFELVTFVIPNGVSVWAEPVEERLDIYRVFLCDVISFFHLSIRPSNSVDMVTSIHR